MKKEKIAVAMSGGVDSAVAAALLLDNGYDVFGVTMILLGDLSHAESAKRVCKRLNIPHHVVDFTSVFKEKVINPFCDEYISGITPNPCVVCNKQIKAGVLLDWALSNGASHLATGHYVRVKHNSDSNRFLLYKGKDAVKDQSYFLWSLNQSQLGCLKTPLGELLKSEVSQIAAERGFSELEPESQEICFIPKNNYGDFLREKFKELVCPGDIIDKAGKVLGRHKGLPFYTIGQRKGLGISFREPLYVIDLIREKNVVVAGSEDDLYKSGLVATNLNFISLNGLSGEMNVEAQIRYNMKPSAARLSLFKKDKIVVEFKEKQRAITPGQSVVLYQGENVLGGGIIYSAR